MFLERFNVVMKAIEIMDYWYTNILEYPLAVAGGLIIRARRGDVGGPTLEIIGLPPNQHYREIEFESYVFPSDVTYPYYDIKAVYNENENAVYFVIRGKDAAGYTLSELHCLDISNFTVEGIASFSVIPLLAYDKLNKSVYVIGYNIEH